MKAITKTEAPASCRRLDPYSSKLDYRKAGVMGMTAAQACIIRKEISKGNRVETSLGVAVTDARSHAGKLQIRTFAGDWLTEKPYFSHP